MRFVPPLQPATLKRRYKRFLADIVLPDGREATAHVANPGKMLGCDAPGSRVWIGESKGALPYSVKFVETPTGWAGVDTHLPNKLVAEALEANALGDLRSEAPVRREAAYGSRSRVDFLLRIGGAPLWLEIKNVHLSRREGLAEFPDCVAARSTRQLDELGDRVDAGERAVVLFVVQRAGCERLSFAEDLDPGFAAAIRRAADRGIDIQAYRCAMSPGAVTFETPIEVELPRYAPR